MSSVPLITFGIPAYQRPALLAETLASLASQEGGFDFDVIVCDDGGLAETRRIVENFSAKPIALHVNSPRLGAVENWNRCLQLARGRWVMVLHEDDTLYPWYLSLVAPRLRDGLAAVCTQTVQGPVPPVLAPPKKTPAARAYPPRFFLKSAFTPFPGVLIDRALALRLGGFDARWGALADYEFWYRLASADPVEVIRAVGAFYRVSEGQWTDTEWPGMLRRMHLLRLRIAREQFPAQPRLGLWLARFFTARAARSYARRFSEKPAVLARSLRFQKIPCSAAPSGWVWQAMKLFSR